MALSGYSANTPSNAKFFHSAGSLRHCTITGDTFIQVGPNTLGVTLDSCRVESLHLMGTETNLPISVFFSIFNSCFDGLFTCEKINFSSRFICLGTKFRSMANFHSVWFNGGARFGSDSGRPTVFVSGANFVDVYFRYPAMFGGVNFSMPHDVPEMIRDLKSLGLPTEFGQSGFFGAHFLSDAEFEEANLEGCAFKSCDIAGRANFRNANIIDLGLTNTTFASETWFQGGPAKGVKCQNVTFLGPVDLSRKPVLEISFAERPISSFQKRTFFDHSVLSNADFHSVNFRDVCTFTGATFTNRASFEDTFFGDDVNFRHATFPPAIGTNGVLFDGCFFVKGLFLDWIQVTETPGGKEPVRLIVKDTSTWEDLRDAFKRTRNLAGEVESDYQCSLLRMRNNEPPVHALFHSWYLDWALWGFGFRPVRLACWMAGFWFFFGVLFWLGRARSCARADEVSGLNNAAPKVARSGLTDQLAFSWRIGFEVRRKGWTQLGPVMRSAAWLEWLLMKCLAVLLIQAAANVHPLLHELLGKFLP